MDLLKHEIRGCCNLLDSNKITERKKKSSDLLDYLQRKEVLTLLNNNSENKEDVTWDSVLLAAHRGLLKESDRIRDEEQKGGNQASTSKFESTKSSFCTLIYTITVRANTGGVQRLTIGPLLQCVLSVLQDAFLRKHFGYTYLQVLRFQVLTTHTYYMSIDEDVWKDLFQLLQQTYPSPPPKVEKATILTTLNLIVKNGACHSFLALDVKKMFPTLCKWIKADIKKLNLQEHLAQLALTVCGLLLYECRMSICKFGEDVMSEFRSIYDHRADGVSKKKDLLLDWFVLQVQIHHPGGAPRGADAAYAADWNVWARQLGCLYQLVTAETKAVLHHRTIRHLRPSFVTLAVAVCKQMFLTSSTDMLDVSIIPNLNDTSMMEGNATKRLRLESGVQAILDKLSNTKQQDMWPWLSILAALSNTHPEAISETDVTSLLQFCAEQLLTCKDITSMESLYRCCNAMLYVETKKEFHLLDTKKLSELWNSVWETCLRAIGLNLCEEWSHQLVQHLVLENRLVPVDQLLDLYVSGAIHRTKHSLDTLYCLSTRVCMTDRLNTKQCKILQEWVLPSREEAAQDDLVSLLPCTDLVAKVMLALSIKDKVNEVIDKSSVYSMNDFEQHYIYNSFEDGPFVQVKCMEPSTQDIQRKLILQDNELLEHMVTLLTREHFVTKEKATPGGNAAVQMLTLHSSLLFHLIATSHQWGLTLDDRPKTYLCESCDAVAEGVESILTRKTEIHIISSVLEHLVSLFQLFSTADVPICRTLVKRLGTDYVIQACSKLTVVSQRAHHLTSDFDFDETDTAASSSSAAETSPFDKENMKGWSLVQLAAYKIILEYRKWGPGELMSRWLELPVSTIKDISSACALQMAFYAAKLVCSMPVVEPEVLEELLVTLQSLCRKWHTSDIAIIAIINIFKDMCHHVRSYEDCQANYLVLISGVLKFIKMRKYGAHVCCQFLELLDLVATVDKSASWSTRVADDGSVRPLTHEMLFFFNSPFYQVRITACKMIGTLFSTAYQQQIFDDLLAAVNGLFFIQGELLVDEELDEGVSRTATALHCLAAISVFTSKWRTKALFNMFDITVNKNLNTVLVNKVLTMVAKHEGIEQATEFVQPALSVILWHWHDKNNSFNSFPWRLLGYNSDAQFYSAQLQVVLPVVVHRQDTQSLQQIASILNQPISALIEICYPELLGSVLPCFADVQQQETATIIISTIEEYLGDEKVRSLLVGKMADVITCIFSNLQDPNDLEILSEGKLLELPESTKLMFPISLVEGGISYIQENSPRSDLYLWEYLSQEKPRLIQKVLLKLYTKVHKAKLLEFKSLYLHQFVALCNMLVRMVARPQYRLSRFTVCWVVRVLLHLAPGNVGWVTVCYLQRFLSTVMSSMFYRSLYLHQFVALCNMLVRMVARPQYRLSRFTVCWVVRVLLHLAPGNVGWVTVCYLQRFLSTVMSSMFYRSLYLHQFVALCNMLVRMVARPQYRLSRFTVCWVVRVLLHLAPGNVGWVTVCYLQRFLSTVMSSMFYRSLYLHQFVALCNMLVRMVARPQYRLSRFTVCWVVRVLLHLAPGNVGWVTVCYLQRFLSTVLKCHTPLVDSLLPLITTTLVPLASSTSPVGRKVLEVLELLLKSGPYNLVSVASLEPLPVEPMFAAMTEQYEKQRYAAPLSTSLRAEVQHMLKNSQSSSTHHESLKHLRRKLAEKKIELAELYKELQNSRGFTEDCEESILHQLVSLLIQITSSSNPKSSYEAACCLGELGPADLTTLCLKPEISACSNQPLDVFLKCVLQHLSKYIFDSDVAVIQATSDALYSLFTRFSHQLSEILTEEQFELFCPFISSTKKQRKVVSISENELKDVMEMFCPDEASSHRQWITKLMSAFLHSAELGYLTPVCNLKDEFCNELCPLTIDLVLHTIDKRSCTELFIIQINEFFSRHSNTDSSVEVYGSRDSVFTMLKVVHIVRKYTDVQRKVNYLNISKAALFCSAYFTSVLYGELWASEYNSDREDLDVEGLTQLEYIEEKDSEKGQILQNLLREAYMKIGEPDAVYGCGNSHLLDRQTQILHYQYEGQWRSVVEACDMQLAQDPTFQLQALQNSLHYCGLYHLAGRVSERQNYEASWRLGQWDLVEPETHSYDSLVYCGLRSLRGGDTARALEAVHRARGLVVQALAHTSLEAATNVYIPLAKLQALQEIEDFASLDFLSCAQKWEEQDKVGWNKFTQVESVFAQRITMLRIKENLNQEMCAKVLLSAIEAAKQAGLFAVAHSWLMSLFHLKQLPPSQSLSVQLLEAQLYWDKQETDTARHHLRRLLGQLKDTEYSTLYARALQTYGSLVASTRSEHAQQILDKYLIPAVEISDNEFKLVSALTLARYADSEYQTLLSYIKSSAYTNKMNSISESLSSAQKLSKAAEATKKSTDIDRQARVDLQKSINMHDKQSKIDQTEVENVQRELDNFLILAIRHYMLSLEIGESDNLCIFRVVSLWLNNYDHEELQEELSKHINKVPTFKVLPVLPQLVARITENTGEPSIFLLHSLIERCAKDHPHHVLPLIQALANSHKDMDYSQSPLQRSSKPESRVVAAQNMLNNMKQKNSLKTLVRDMQVVAEAYISLANLPHVPDKSSKVYKIPKSEPITKLKCLDHVLCPTVTLPIKKSGNYKDVLGIQGFIETYYCVGGINVPKKIECICTDGRKRPQLVKGNDDLRQDAVMQQVFTIMNSLLEENKETLTRRLLIRTYKVVPLSQRSGVIEWCSNTTPLATFLIGGGGVVGAHTRYRKRDWSPAMCRQKMMDVAKSSNAKKLAVFKEVCSHFKPVFRYFFFENFQNPGIWFERKLAYTHSVATSSMVGYMLGLGDRHVCNILIDQQTAEVIHIDFGIAFEQGRTLVTPETVPFRLTRDIVDGMGVSGIEGVFRRSCEKTVIVLRECQSTIITILEVLLYDPLYVWTMTPAKAIAKQSNSGTSRVLQLQPSQACEGQVNKLAKRALLRLKQKLQGIEEGSTTSVEGQVSKLIQEATDPVNLSRLFNGWQAHV